MVIEDLENQTSVKDIISSNPSFIIKWGMIILLLAVTFIILISAKVNYPELRNIELKDNTTPDIAQTDKLILKCKIPSFEIKKGDHIIINIKEYPGNTYNEFKGTINHIQINDSNTACDIHVNLDKAINKYGINNGSSFDIKAKLVLYRKTFLEAILTNLKILK